MKYAVRILFTINLIGFIAGIYFHFQEQFLTSKKCIGFSIMGLFFVFIPVFLVYRFSKSDRSKYIFNPTERNEDLEDWMQGK